MTYGQQPVCRRGGCSEPAVDRPGLPPGDEGFCVEHLGEVRRTRARLVQAAEKLQGRGRIR